MLERRPKVLGMERVKRESMEPPLHRKRSARPMCHASSREAHRQHRMAYWAFATAFRAASADWTRGRVRADFPAACFKPFISKEIQIV